MNKNIFLLWKCLLLQCSFHGIKFDFVNELGLVRMFLVIMFMINESASFFI